MPSTPANSGDLAQGAGGRLGLTLPSRWATLNSPFPDGGSISGGPAALQILALSRDVDLDASQGSVFNVSLRSHAAQTALNPREYSALWQLCGARRRRNGFLPPADEIERTKGKLLSAGLLVPVNLNGVELGPDHHVSLGEVDLQPSLYEVLEGTRRLGFLGSFDALIFTACDGTRDSHALVAWASEQGYQANVANVESSLARLRAAQLVGNAANGRPARRPELAMRLDAVIARPPYSEVGFLLDPDESDIVGRCRGGCTMAELMAEAGTDQDRAWIQGVVAKACALGLTVVSAQVAESPAAHHPFLEPPMDDDFDGNTTVEPIPMPPSAAPVRPAPAPAYVAPPTRTTPAPFQAVSPPVRVTPSAPMQAAMPTRATPPNGMRAAPQRATTNTPVPGVPMRTQTPPYGMGPPMATPPYGVQEEAAPYPPARPSAPHMAAVDPSMQNKLASLAALSLDKDGSAPSSSQPSHRHRGSSSKAPWILLALVVAGGGFYHYKTVSKQEGASAKTTTTTTGSAETAPKPPPSTLVAAGYVAARAPILLSPKTSGRLEELKVDTGQQVKKNQLLATVSDGQARAELTMRQADLSAASRQLKLTKQLVAAQAATRVDLQKAMSAVDVAGAGVRAAQQRLEETKIRSPIDGTVLEILVRPGEAISGATAGVMKLANLNELLAEINVAENALNQVYVSQSCEAVSEAAPDRVHKGTVREISEQADRARGTVLVKVYLEAITDGSLKPGMAVQVRCMPKPAPGEAPAGDAAGSGATPAGSGSAASAAGSAAASGSAAAVEAGSSAANK